MNISARGVQILTAVFLLSGLQLIGQAENIGWHLQDPALDGVNGTRVETVYKAHRGQPSSTVVVAILDTGVDIDHEDLKDNLWINTDEIANNGIDDDNNGYIDDIHGWNFMGNADGTNIDGETLEVTRLYGHYKAYFKDKDVSKLNKKDKAKYEDYQKYKQSVEKEINKAKMTIANLDNNEEALLEATAAFKKKYPNKKLTAEYMKNFDPGTDQQMFIVQQIFEQVSQFGSDPESIEEIEEEIEYGYEVAKEDFAQKLEYWYNPDFDSREIIGDDIDDPKDKYYGNPDVKGPGSFHGTHVAGIVGAVRGNDTGVKGIVENVQLMAVRMLPDGDEHDKDVANAIRYAVDNGASVVNMSFGKGQSYDKNSVDKAVKYARKKDVLLIHAAGNEADDNDEIDHFPVPWFEKSGLFGKKVADNWIEVGALNPTPGESAIASFSNYGAESVDLFAPGGQINSTAPDNTYRPASGTSMASPVVAGVAALIRSYYPELTAQQVKSILMESVTPLDYEVEQPGTGEMVRISDLCISGGMIDAQKAFDLASKTKGKKKNRKPAPQANSRA